MKVLFVTWDSGAVDYLNSLFLPTFAALKKHGVQMHVFQGTWGDDAAIERTATHAYQLGIPYRALRMPAHHRKARTPYMMARMALEITRCVREKDFDVVMPRAMVPGAVALLAKPYLGATRIVWDADGLPADERVDFAGWSRVGPAYWSMRTAEYALLHQASAVMVRTQHAADILKKRAGRFSSAPLHVVPNGRDASVYRPDAKARARVRAQHNIDKAARVLISVGSLGPQYYPDTQAKIAAALLRQDSTAHAVFLTAQDDLIRQHMHAYGADMSRVIAQRVPATEVPAWLAAADVGLALRKPAFSQQAVCPLKVGEYLLAGLPVIANAGVGDLDTQLTDAARFFFESEGEANVAELLDWMRDHTPRTPQRETECRDIGLQHFSLEAAVEGYVRLLGV